MKKIKRVKAIIFDFDGTIANTLPYTFKKIIDLSKKLKIQKDQKEIIKIIQESNPKELREKFRISWFRIPLIIWEIRQAQKLLYQEIDRIKPFPGIKTLIKKLYQEDFQLFIYSSNLKNNISYFLKNHLLASYFKKIYVGQNLLGKDKDLLKILKENQIKKDQVVYIGDEIRDVLACQKAGIKIIGVAWGFAGEKVLKKTKADFVVKKPEEIYFLLKN